MGDIDGDGNLDLVLTGEDRDFNESARLFLGDGEGGFEEVEAANLGGVVNGSSSLGDLDGDGDLDLLITGDSFAGSDSRPISALYVLNENDAFERRGVVSSGESGSISMGDINGDGNLDLVTTGEDDRLAEVSLGDGTGEFVEAESGSPGLRSRSTSLGDLDGGGTLDLVIPGVAWAR